ncbi:MAG: hypothetical protein K9J13_13275 [Saprospiraceae bacterium]|nr:hypothetical protein [Saprospiraceae bacterium]
MKVVQRIKHIMTVIVAMVVFITSTGFNIYHHHCKINKTTSTSFFINNTSCDHSEKHHEEKHHHSSSCCEKKFTSNCDESYEEQECCDITKTFHKIEILNKVEKSVQQFEITALDIFVLTSIFTSTETEELSNEIINKESPPLLFGKELIYFIQNIKIPYRLF